VSFEKVWEEGADSKVAGAGGGKKEMLERDKVLKRSMLPFPSLSLPDG